MDITLYNFKTNFNGIETSDEDFHVTNLILDRKKEMRDFWFDYLTKQLNIWDMANGDVEISKPENPLAIIATVMFPNYLKGKDWFMTLIQNAFNKAYNEIYETDITFSFSANKFWDEDWINIKLV